MPITLRNCPARGVAGRDVDGGEMDCSVCSSVFDSSYIAMCSTHTRLRVHVGSVVQSSSPESKLQYVLMKHVGNFSAQCEYREESLREEMGVTAAGSGPTCQLNGRAS